MDVITVFDEINRKEGLDLKIKEVKSPDKNIDLVLQINNEKIFVEQKNEVRPNQINQLYKQAELYSNKIFLIASNYITPSAKELLKERKINYLDKAGNIYLKLRKGILYREGIYNQSPSEKYKNRAFTKVGAKLIYVLLRRPSYVNVNYRSLSAISTCSLGSITKIFDQLKEEKYIIKLPDGKYKLVQYEKLRDKWIEVLKMHLLPSMLIGKYDFAGDKKWYEIDLKKKTGYKWGGEVAAAILTKNLKPQDYTIYTTKKENEIIRGLKLIPNRDGQLTVYKEFWKGGSTGISSDHVDPLLIYAELLSTADSRNIEVANEIKKKYLDDNI